MEIIAGGEKTYRITNLSLQAKNPDRVNVFVDDKYSFSLDVAQVADLGVKIGLEISDDILVELKEASEFGKLYVRALEWALVRPRSVKETKDYLYKKTLDKKVRVLNMDRSGTTACKLKSGVSSKVTEAVLKKLVEKGYVDDYKFAAFWAENRNLRKGISAKRLRLELMKKGVDSGVIEEVLAGGERNDSDEMQKIIAKKRKKYDDKQLVAYLVRQGFDYYEAKEAVTKSYDD